MAYQASVDPSFYSRIIDKSVDAGFIVAPSELNGRDVSYIPSSRYSTFLSCNCCCFIGGGRGDKAGLVLVIIMAVAAFFVGLFFTAKSVKEAQELHADLKTVESRLSNVQPRTSGSMPRFSFPQTAMQPPGYQMGYAAPAPVHVQGYPHYQMQAPGMVTPPYGSPMGMPPQSGYSYAPQPVQQHGHGNPQYGAFPAQPPQYNQNFPQPDYVPLQPYGVPAQPLSAPPVDFVVAQGQQFSSADEAAAVLLKGRRNERIWTAISQGIMTVGAGLITVAILVALVAEAEILIINCSLAGSAAGIGGLALYAIRWCRPNTEEQAAANWLSSYLSGLQPVIQAV